MCILFVFS